MTAIQQITVSAATGGAPARLAASRVEKARHTSDLRNGMQGDADARARRDAHSVARQLSRSETDARDPLWHGPRLQSAFVAQVLGQVMPGEARDARSAFAAYGSGARARSQIAFERRV